MKTLVVGVGNPTRGDDGAGPVVAERISALALPDVDVVEMHQLQIELVEEFHRYDRVVVVDASTVGGSVEFRTVTPEEGGSASTHHLSPSTLLALMRQLQRRPPELVLCTVRGENFEFRETLTLEVQLRVNQAVARIIHWIDSP